MNKRLLKKIAPITVSLVGIVILIGICTFIYFHKFLPRMSANDFIVKQVGSEEFSKNFKFLSEEDYIAYHIHNLNRNHGKKEKYLFIPGVKYDIPEIQIISYFDGKSESFLTHFPLPNCTKDINHCNFKVTQEQLNQTLNTEGIDKFDGFSMYQAEVVAEASDCVFYHDVNSRQGKKDQRILVSLQTSKVVFRTDNLCAME
jgi:hypothetical protein